jgi:REP element-mobilizing transposase RayT
MNTEDTNGRARPPGGPSRVKLSHLPPAWIKTGAVYFITICCEQRGANQLCHASVVDILFGAARHYHEKQDWFLRQMLLMPNHVHALIAPAPDKKIEALVSNWKRYTALKTSIVWQKIFFRSSVAFR